MPQINGGQALIRALEMEGVEVIFGLPGGAILPVYDPIIDSPIRHILVRHEQGAGHMAEGFAQATGRPGVAMVTKAKPRGRPDSRSTGSLTSMTVPCAENRSCRSVSLVVKARLPTYNFELFMMICLDRLFF